jgi:hypothetical protein
MLCRFDEIMARRVIRPLAGEPKKGATPHRLRRTACDRIRGLRS